MKTATVISGHEIACDLKMEIKNEILKLKSKWVSFIPRLTILQVGDNYSTNIIIDLKSKAAKETGIDVIIEKFSNRVMESELLSRIKILNEDNQIHGIMIQLPLDCTTDINVDRVIQAVNIEKDVDGLKLETCGKLARNSPNIICLPCTAASIIEIIKRTGCCISGSHAVVVGRCFVTGVPIRNILLNHNATVTVCHSKTRNLKEIVSWADILVVAINKPLFIKGHWMKPGAVVIDCGRNYIQETAHTLCGDVDIETAINVAGFITPVPGGIGPIIITMLMKNTLLAAFFCITKNKCWPLSASTDYVKSTLE